MCIHIPALWTGQGEKRKDVENVSVKESMNFFRNSQKCPNGLVRVSGWININTPVGKERRNYENLQPAVYP